MERTFRPNPALTRARVIGIAVPAIIAALAQSAFAGKNFGQSILVGLVLSGLIVAFAALYIWLHGRNTLIEASPAKLRIRNWIGAAHSVAPWHLAKAVFVPGIVPMKNGDQNNLGARLFVLDDSGRAVLRWRETTWTQDQMHGLMTSLNLSSDELGQAISLRDLHERYPRALRFGEVRPYVAVALIVGAFVVFCTAIVVALIVTAPS